MKKENEAQNEDNNGNDKVEVKLQEKTAVGVREKPEEKNETPVATVNLAEEKLAKPVVIPKKQSEKSAYPISDPYREGIA